MSVPKLISPMLDNFNMGEPISEHDGVRCCPAMEKHSEDKYIVKIISVPSSQSQLDALLISGAYPNAEAAKEYFKTITDSILAENRLLEKLSQLEGFIPFENCQIEPLDEGTGFDVYLLKPYGTTLQKHMHSYAMTQLDALNLGLDLCSALTVCRQSGYLYANLKPENIYVSNERNYRIGDLGFLKLKSLKYASLPDRYRSEYTAPEITDAYSELNTTIDVYAVGLILYQVFNNGTLPDLTGKGTEDSAFSAPAFADYEMTEIIRKACAADPQDRWQEPEALGQALVSYIQRNGAHDIPIIPVAATTTITEDEENVIGSFEATEDNDVTNAKDDDSVPENSTEESQEEPVVPIPESEIFTEDEDGKLVLLMDDADETLPDELTADIPDAVVTEEVSDMLSQADELISHPAPDPVIPPEPIDVPIPEIVVTEEEEIKSSEEENSADISTEDTESSENTTVDRQDAAVPDSSEAPTPEAESEDATDDNSDDDSQPEDCESSQPEADDYEDVPKKKHPGLIWLLVLAILSAIIGTAGTYFYRNYYLQHIESLTLEETGDGVLTIIVDTDADESLLTVVCTDTYGSPQGSSPVKKGKAVIKDLPPAGKYTIKVVIDGFHKLTGDITESYNAPNKIEVTDFTAEPGMQDGEIVLHFASDAPDSFTWFVSYTDDNGNTIETAATDNTVTINSLTVGKNYTFTLSSPEADRLVGATTVSFTAKAFIKATDLTVTGCINNELHLTWAVPDGISVRSWTVRCTGKNGFDETKTVKTTSVFFTVPDDSISYSLEVIAEGMIHGESTRSPENSVTIAQMQVDDTHPTQLKVTWEAHGNIPSNGWTLWYTIDGIPQEEIHANECEAIISPVIPNALYSITAEPVDEIFTMGGSLEHTTSDAEKFKGYGIQADDIDFTMCLRPDSNSWDRYDVSKSDKRNEFTAEEPIGLLMHINNTYNTSADEIETLFVIRDADGNLVERCTSVAIWDDMWSRGHGTLALPSSPNTPGTYTVSIYFNGSHVTDCALTISG